MESTRSRRTILATGAGATLALAGMNRSRAFAAPAFLRSTPLEVRYWTSFSTGTYGEAQNRIIQNFMAQNPDIRIVPSIQPNYGDMAAALITALQTGDEPHVAILADVFWFRFYLAQALADMTPLLAELKVDTADFVQPLYTEFSRHDGQWMLSFARSTPLMYYNEDALTAAGLDPSVFQTWSSFAEAAPRLAGGTTPYALGLAGGHPTSTWTMQGPVWAFGGAYSTDDFTITVNEPKTVGTGEFFQKLLTDKVATATVDPVKDFTTGLSAAIVASTGAIGGIKEAARFTVGAVPLPREEQIGCPTGGSGLAIMASASDEVKLAAMKFVAFTTNTANAAAWAQATGYMPVRTSAIASDPMQAFLKDNPIYRVAIDQLPDARHPDAALNLLPNGSSILNLGWDTVLVRRSDVQAAFDQAKADLDEDKQDVVDQLHEIEG